MGHRPLRTETGYEEVPVRNEVFTAICKETTKRRGLLGKNVFTWQFFRRVEHRVEQRRQPHTRRRETVIRHGDILVEVVLADPSVFGDRVCVAVSQRVALGRPCHGV